MKRKSLKEFISLALSIIVLVSSTPISAQGYSNHYQFRHDTPADFDAFLQQCSLEERIALMQSLHGVNKDIKDEYFGKLAKLPALYSFTTDKDKASQSYPLKPETFNEVLPATVADAVNKGYLKGSMFSPDEIKRELVWRRYNKVNFFWHEKKTIDYHNDIVKWIAEDKEVKDFKYLPTFELERKIALKYFEEIWEKLTPSQREELLSRIEKETGTAIENKAAIALQSGALAIGALSVTVAFTGFAFYTTMSTVMCTVAAWFGATLPFAAYTGMATTVAVVSGPIGWCIAGLATVGSAFMMGMNEPDTVAAFVITVNSIKSKWQKTKW